MSQKCVFATLLLASIVAAQQPGELTPEVHPLLSSQKCTTAGGCVAVNSSIVLDANFRWLHNKGGYTNCVTTGFNTTICPDIETCAANCVLEGVDYSTYGISSDGDSLSLNLFVQKDNATSLSSPRVYLMSNDTTYESFQLLNQEFTFDVDVSAVPCGINGALYFSEMNPTGDANELNAAGAAYGTGYCDAQCPTQNFIHGEANLNMTYGACCNEMDIWEANNAATAFTPHPCNTTQVTSCSGAQCGQGDDRYDGLCDADGCDYNAYRMGAKEFYGPNLTIDTTKPFTVVTQFFTADNTSTGVLSEIRRIYVQNGVVISNAALTTPGIDPGNSITDGFCAQQKTAFNATNAFAARGGLDQMGEALGRGMVLALSIWDDSGSEMLWLDSTYPTTATADTPGADRGPCSADSGDPATLLATYPDAKVIFSAIKSGDIGSTFAADASGTGTM